MKEPTKQVKQWGNFERSFVTHSESILHFLHNCCADSWSSKWASLCSKRNLEWIAVPPAAMLPCALCTMSLLAYYKSNTLP